VFRHPFSFLRSLTAWRADLAGFGLGAATAAALPPLHVIPVLLLTMPGLIALIDGSRSPWGAVRRGWWFGFGLNLFGLYWITEAILIEAARFWWFVPIAVPSLSALMAAFVAVSVGVARLAPHGWRRPLALAGAWVLADLARQFIATGFPWNPLGSVWAIPGIAGTVFLQPLAWIGAPGLTLVTVVLASLPVFGRRGWLIAAAGLLMWGGFGLARINQTAPESPGGKVVLVQGNVEQGQKWDRSLMLAIFRRYLDLTAQGVKEAGDSPTIVVWPETASPFLLTDDPAARQAIVAASGHATVLAGSVRFDEAGRPRNTLVEIAPDGSVVGLYDKWHLVPFGEFQPSWIPLAIQIVPGGGFAGGPGPRTLTVPGDRPGLGNPGLPPVGALICYEAVYPGEMVDEHARPSWLVNITNDAWFGRSTGPRQHLAAARMRAVEEGLPLLRAANTGISAGYDAFGRELGRLGLGVTGVLVLSLPGALPPTPFSQWGLWIPGILALLALIRGLR
jgi:apolipoprotein N-acyltransferase